MSSSNVEAAIAPSGRAIVAQSYDDGSFAGPPDSRGEDNCCTGTKVAIVSPGGRVTSARAVRPRGTRSPLAAVAASANRFGVLVGAPREGGVRFIAVSRSGRAGPPRLIAATHYRGVTLQFAGGRAIVALTDEIPLRIAVSSERAGGAFTAPKVAVRTQGDLQSAFLGRVEVTADGRGRNVVAYDSGTTRGSQVKVVRFDAAGRATTLAGPATVPAPPEIAPPATDGRAVAVAYTESFLSHVPLLVTRTAAGRLRRRTLPSLGGQIHTPAVATGGGAIALTTTPSTARGPLSTRVLYLRSPTARVDRIVLPNLRFGSPPLVIDGRGGRACSGATTTAGSERACARCDAQPGCGRPPHACADGAGRPGRAAPGGRRTGLAHGRGRSARGRAGMSNVVRQALDIRHARRFDPVYGGQLDILAPCCALVGDRPRSSSTWYVRNAPSRAPGPTTGAG